MNLKESLVYFGAGVGGVFFGYWLLVATDRRILSHLEKGDMATWFAACGTILTLAFLIRQHTQLRHEQEQDRAERTNKELSEIAYTKYEHITQRLIDKINSSILEKDKSKIFKSINTTYDNIFLLKNQITTEYHKAAAQATHNELVDVLTQLCQQVTFFDLFSADTPKNKKLKFKWNDSVESCSLHLSACWYQCIRPNLNAFKSTNHATYGWSHYKVESEAVYKTLAILISKDINLTDFESLKSHVQSTKQTCIVQNEFLFELEESAAMLLAHVLLEGNLRTSNKTLSFRTFDRNKFWLVSESLSQQQGGKYFGIPEFKQINFEPYVPSKNSKTEEELRPIFENFKRYWS